MTGSLLAQPVIRAVDATGAPMAGALLQFYVTGTTTPTNVYSGGTLATPLSNPVVADSGGLFVPIYLDPTVTYRCQLQTSTGTVVRDIDPLNAGVLEATQTQVNAGVATGVFVSPAKLAAWSGLPSALGYTPLNKAGDTATNLALAFTSLTAASAGYLGVPVNTQTSAYTLTLQDAAKMIRGNSASALAITVPPNSAVAFPVGTAVLFRNSGAGTLTITRGSGVTLVKAGSGTSQDVAMAQWGVATMFQEYANNWLITGTGIT